MALLYPPKCNGRVRRVRRCDPRFRCRKLTVDTCHLRRELSIIHTSPDEQSARNKTGWPSTNVCGNRPVNAIPSLLNSVEIWNFFRFYGEPRLVVLVSVSELFFIATSRCIVGPPDTAFGTTAHYLNPEATVSIASEC